MQTNLELSLDTLDQELLEAWQSDPVDMRDAYTDSQGFGWLSHKLGYYSSLHDREDGRYAPIYDNEFDLKAIRMAAWLMDAEVPIAKAMKNRLVDYTIASGFDWDIKHESKQVEEYLEVGVKRFFDNCNWCELEAESFEREIVDGEFLAEIVASSGDFGLEVFEGDNLTEPMRAQEINEYLGHYDGNMSWSFGVLTRKNRIKPLAYHIVLDESGSDWRTVEADRFVHWKRNVPQNAKRGATDHYTPHKWLNYGSKVVGATAQGTAIQASIAYIVEHAKGVTAPQAAALANARSNVVTGTNADGTSYRKKPIRPGHVLDINNGSKYHASLLGSNASRIYIEVMEALFRFSGTIHAFPEHMLTGFAGNNNRASSETAESPFLQGRARDQRLRAERFRKLITMVCKVLVERMPGRVLDWEEVELGLEVTVNTPEIRSRDINRLTEALIAQADRGWLSDKQAVQELGRDYDDVQQQIKQQVVGPDSHEIDDDEEDDANGTDSENDDQGPSEKPSGGGDDVKESLTNTQKRLLESWQDYP